MLALTLWPEWAAAFPGVPLRRDGGFVPSQLDKRIENRHYPPPAAIRPLRGRPGEWFGLHAGKYIGGRPYNDVAFGAFMDMIGMARRAGWTFVDVDVDRDTFTLSKGDRTTVVSPRSVVCSAIVALVRVVRVASSEEGEPWKVPGAWGWCLDVRALPEPVPASGAQGLWRVPEATRDRVLALAPPEPSLEAA